MDVQRWQFIDLQSCSRNKEHNFCWMHCKILFTQTAQGQLRQLIVDQSITVEKVGRFVENLFKRYDECRNTVNDFVSQVISRNTYTIYSIEDVTLASQRCLIIIKMLLSRFFPWIISITIFVRPACKYTKYKCWQYIRILQTWVVLFVKNAWFGLMLATPVRDVYLNAAFRRNNNNY